MIKEEFAKIVAVLEETDMNNYAVIEPLWEKEIALFTNDIKATIDFVKNDCTASQFSWMSEVWDEIVEKNKKQRICRLHKRNCKEISSRMCKI